MTRNASGMAGFVVALVLALPAAAQPAAQPLETRLEARKVVRLADGSEGFAPAEAARPGDVIEYVATYTNRSPVALSNLVATLPIPANTEFIPGSARPAPALASVDGREFGPLPLQRIVKQGESAQAVPFREYRGLRWTLASLGAATTRQFSARVRVTD